MDSGSSLRFVSSGTDVCILYAISYAWIRAIVSGSKCCFWNDWFMAARVSSWLRLCEWLIPGGLSR